jgi:hypothetical protein
MKVLRYTLTILAFGALLSSCSVWNRMFPPKYGCGTDGKNVGAEKINDAINSGEKIKVKKFKD